MTINIIFITMWASWIFLWGLGLSEGFFSSSVSIFYQKKFSFSKLFKLLYKLLLLPKYQISFLHGQHPSKVIICSHEIPPLWLFLIHYMQPQLSHVTTTQTTGEQGGGRGAKSAPICLLFASITGTADFDNHIQEISDRSATLLSLCWPTYRKCEQVLRNKVCLVGLWYAQP